MRLHAEPVAWLRRLIDTLFMGKKTGHSYDRAEPADRSLQSAAANAALLLEETMSATDHAVSIDLDPVIELDGELFIRRTPLRDRILRVVAEPVLNAVAIQPVSRWPEHLRSAVRRMHPPQGPPACDGVLDALVDDYARNIESLLGTIRFAAQVEIRPEGYYANIWDDFVLVSRTHAARLSLNAAD
ncbi:hypothetical protein [Nocardia sp. NPDC058705]|uniref:hypothetical protein n=1 Tax=Nocardia sp. NPDC058705 TaxID=3346609 RepID=UPI0036A4AC7A